MTFLCHCRDCQHQSGSANLPLMVVPASSFVPEGATTCFETTGESGRKVFRHFCPTCGSTLYAEAEALPEDILIAAGTLDDTAHYEPARSIHAESRVPWDHLVEALPDG